jgi:hypothetical protein
MENFNLDIELLKVKICDISYYVKSDLEDLSQEELTVILNREIRKNNNMNKRLEKFEESSSKNYQTCHAQTVNNSKIALIKFPDEVIILYNNNWLRLGGVTYNGIGSTLLDNLLKGTGRTYKIITERKKL